VNRVGYFGEMLEKDFEEIPDLHFDIQLLIADSPYIVSRLDFACTPKGTLLGLDMNGRKVSFTANVYELPLSVNGANNACTSTCRPWSSSSLA
jgi:predicted ester cyclase